MPFAAEFEDVYKYLISEGLESAGYIVKRADDIKSQSNIIGDIVKGITTSDLIVADLTGANPNVYYELGIAHALNKKVILITQEIDDLPFDLRSYRVIGYSVYFAKMNQAKKELSELANEAFNGRLPFGNPVKDFGNINRQPKEFSIISNDVESLLDNEDRYTRTQYPEIPIIKKSELITLGKDIQFSKELFFSLPKNCSWIRASAEISTPQKEWDMWRMPQFIIKFYRSGSVTKSNYIRISRLLSDGEVKNIKIDALVPKNYIDSVSISFWNAGSDKQIFIYKLKVVGYKK